MNRLNYSRDVRTGEFPLSESKLAKLNAQLYERSVEPHVPISLMSAASREFISHAHRIATAQRISFSQAAGLLVRERPQLFKLTRCQAVLDGESGADVEIDDDE